MQHPWKPERQVSLGLAKKLIEEQFPELAPAKLVKLGLGWDNIAYFVNKTFVFRFPQRKIATDLIVTERRVLPHIAAHLPVPIPIPILFGEPTEAYPWPFAGHEYLYGRAACISNPSEEERIRLAPQIANFLRKLHDIPPEDAVVRHSKRNQLKRLNPKKQGSELLQRIAALSGKNFISDSSPWAAIIEEAQDVNLPETDCIVHGDLYARHLLLDEDNNLSGVIDWGDVHRGHPAIDLAIAWSFLPATARKSFRETYGTIEDSSWILARFRALHTVSYLVLYGLDISDDTLVTEGKKGLSYLLQT